MSALGFPAALVEEARAAHASAGRAYHTFAHVEEVLGWVDVVAREVRWEHEVEARLAALFHDAVYVAGRGDNEGESARLAKAAIGRHLDPDAVDVERVERTILATARHGHLQPGDVDRDVALFLDADMAILGAPEARFDAYDRAIAIEYREVPADVFAAGRRRFLEGLLVAQRIYLSPFFHDRLDGAARANLRRALAR